MCEEEGSASAVLIRALEPTHGIPTMQRRRGLREERALCSGPGKLCEALAVTHKHNGLALDRAPFELRARSEKPEIAIGRAHRHHQSGEETLALRAEGLTVSEQAVQVDLDVIPGPHIPLHRHGRA